ncbi:MAG: sulfite exporter TauE/SafE family protein [Candidatus Omnitrophica bacterium]|nr:sulfite exporter TauE/SafE family protein [Candidatus Omnitrophota bacterium]
MENMIRAVWRWFRSKEVAIGVVSGLLGIAAFVIPLTRRFLWAGLKRARGSAKSIFLLPSKISSLEERLERLEQTVRSSKQPSATSVPYVATAPKMITVREKFSAVIYDLTYPDEKHPLGDRDIIVENPKCPLHQVTMEYKQPVYAAGKPSGWDCPGCQFVPKSQADQLRVQAISNVVKRRPE